MPKAKKKSKGWNKKLTALFVFFGAVIVFIAAYGFFASSNNSKTSVKSASIVSVPRFDHIAVIIEENHGDKSILKSPQATYIRSLASQYSYASEYYASGHPSLPNYLIMTSGSSWGINRSCLPSDCNTDGRNIADLVEAKGLSWKAYFEDMPDVCWKSDTDLYYTDYNPFIYYNGISQNPDRCAKHVVPFSQFSSDLSSIDTLPNLVFISPNSCNDMHNCPIGTGDAWLAKTATQILDSPAFTKQRSLLIVMWDESEKPNRDNNVPFILAGPEVKKGYISEARYGHLSLLKTIEAALGLPALNNKDESASLMSEFFNDTRIKIGGMDNI